MSAKRLPAVAFGALALATVGAFFLTQVLRTAPPPVWYTPKPVPSAIDPLHGRVCFNSKGPLDYDRTEIKFEVSHAGSVGVYVVSAKDQAGPSLATITSGRQMRMSVPGTKQWYPASFTWNGRLADGRIAPAGTYYFRILLEGQSVDLSDSPLQVITQPPRARVTGVTLLGQKASASGPTVFTPGHGTLKISYTPGHYRRLWIDVYRTDVSGKPRLVAPPIPAKRTGSWARWNGEIGGRPAPAGTYLFGITAQNLACDQASWPVVVPPPAGTTPHAGVSIRYLTVTPPLTPTVSGADASVAVQSPDAGFTWTLHRSGTSKVLAHGFGAAGSSAIAVAMPRHRPGLYTLVVRSGTHSAAVPLVASQAGAVAARARVLVVLPMLTWIGESPVDDSGDGLPDTLRGGDAVSLQRPLVDGPPASLRADAELLAYLDAQHLRYQLTTDVALAEGRGPSLVDRWGVLFADGEDFVPAALASARSGLPVFVRAGGRVLVLGTGSFAGTSRLSGPPTALSAAAPSLSGTDMFGAVRGPLASTGGDLLTELTDKLGLFNGLVAFSGYSHYQSIKPPASPAVSAAGIAEGAPAIVAFRYGSGDVIEAGLPDFGATLAQNVDSQELLTSAWRLLAKQG